MARVETNGVATYYERSGDGPPVVFIHGAGLDHRMWRPQIAALEAEYETVAYDYRGHGGTEPTDREALSVGLLAEDLRALVQELGLDRPVLCGHSYGGLIAAEYAIRYPDDVAGLVFADGRTDYGENVFEKMIVRINPVFERLEEIVGEKRIDATKQFISERVMDADQAPNEEIPELGMTRDEYTEDARDAAPDDLTQKLLDAGIAYVGTSPTDFHVPVLYAYGEMTANVIADKAERLERAPTDVRVEEIQGGGHGFPLEQPEAFVEVLREFLEEAFSEPNGVGVDADD